MPENKVKLWDKLETMRADDQSLAPALLTIDERPTLNSAILRHRIFRDIFIMLYCFQRVCLSVCLSVKQNVVLHTTRYIRGCECFGCQCLFVCVFFRFIESCSKMQGLWRCDWCTTDTAGLNDSSLSLRQQFSSPRI